MSTFYTRTLSLLSAILFMVGAIGVTQAQPQASHNVQINIQSFSYINVSGDLSATLNAYDIQQGNGGVTGNVAAVSGPSNGIITVALDQTDVTYGTNSSNDQKVTVETDGANPYQLRTSANGSIGNVTTGQNGSAGTYAGGVSITNSQTDVVTGVSQAEGTLSLNYKFDFNVFDAPTSESQNITYTITAN